MAKKNTVEIGFEKEIWKAADLLRGNLDASGTTREIYI
ncbi:type I restriction-modification system subunit M N-terminal domain-containing protein [Odoribacter sp. OttesenSCG-928-J03]|nr:type I restriction-modification system subunit M N-terminal domain-containing protein [Odoribacter sp. OttesenSCG-928-J03]MDL2282934.1 type I restriction-modification system subunit M N-terminal domain-containing protein [Odoribacter sp. OttesenSCG-928-G04]